jgi:drug/metabolite transporter (DMT)-like permease
VSTPEADLLRPRVLIPFLIVTAIWGSTWLVIRDQVSTVPPSWTVTWRFTVAAIGMVTLALVRRESLRLPREGMVLALLVGITQFVANFQFVYRAEQHLTSGIVAVLYALLIVPNALLARAFLKQPITARFLAGSMVALGGIALLLLHEYRVAPPGGRVLFGVAMTLCGLMGASSANILQATEVGRRQPLVPMIAWAMVLGALIDAAFSWIVAGPPVLDPRPAYLGGILYLAIFGSVVTFPLYFELIRVMGAGRAAYNSVIVPVVAMGLSTVFEGYRWTGLAIGGAVLAMVGLVIALSGRRTSPSAVQASVSPPEPA